MVKFLTPIYVYFYFFNNGQKFKLEPHPPLSVGKVVGTIQLIFTVSHSYISSLYTIIELCDSATFLSSQSALLTWRSDLACLNP